ncbi:hypothetical protein GCM10007301_35170 [Azorhizobium oxalatiphilum]|uniref:Ricin B lectin domain-containing protein n=1 Tax=Azorhizobium oxalatiphilum TaxID=980631 RepID=A0A917C4W2_9HYPH|nr:RICIN domain-containing protein [Azorhizobium oxalatiphilum]GGF72343.1 hypothetical protein GCM10007301_35170 [Azorhizobium oxalatiphilum]
MPQVIITYAANPAYALAATNPQTNAPVTLQPVVKTPLSQLLWNVNRLNGLITLAASVSPNILALSTSGQNQSPITLQLLAPGSANQQWNFLIGTTVINSIGFPGYVIDNEGRGTTAGNTIWLYPVNGSPAQQWNLEVQDAASVAAVAKELAPA